VTKEERVTRYELIDELNSLENKIFEKEELYTPELKDKIKKFRALINRIKL